MKGLVLVWLPVMVSTICRPQQVQTGKWDSSHARLSEVNGQSIIGAWLHQKWTLYRTLYFTDSTIYIDSHIDTVIYSKYAVSADTLTIWAGGQ